MEKSQALESSTLGPWDWQFPPNAGIQVGSQKIVCVCVSAQGMVTLHAGYSPGMLRGKEVGRGEAELHGGASDCSS